MLIAGMLCKWSTLIFVCSVGRRIARARPSPGIKLPTTCLLLMSGKCPRACMSEINLGFAIFMTDLESAMSGTDEDYLGCLTDTDLSLFSCVIRTLLPCPELILLFPG